MGQLKTTEVYSLPVLEAPSATWKCHLPVLASVRVSHSTACSQPLVSPAVVALWLVDEALQPLPLHCVTFSVSLCLLLFVSCEDTPLLLGPTPIQNDLISNLTLITSTKKTVPKRGRILRSGEVRLLGAHYLT